MTLEVNPLPQEKPETVWDLYVPIVQDVQGVYHAYLTSDIESPDHYNELCYTLKQLTPDDQMYIHLNTPGGSLDSACFIMAAIKKSAGTVKALCTGTVASAGTLIALTCDDLEVDEFTSFMIHNYSTDTNGKGNELKEYMRFSEKQMTALYTNVYSGFLSNSEIQDVIEDKDKWFSSTEVTARWSNMVQLRSDNV
jgi:ATP-dependent protease ClpP protease subunit